MTRLVALIPSGRRLGAGLSPLQLQPDPDRRLYIYQAAAVRGTGRSHSPHGRAMTFHVRESDCLESLRARERSRSSTLRPPTIAREDLRISRVPQFSRKYAAWWIPHPSFPSYGLRTTSRPRLRLLCNTARVDQSKSPIPTLCRVQST